MDTQTMLGLALGLSAGAAVVQTLRHSALSSRLIRAKRDGGTLHESLQAALADLQQARDERSAALQSLADRTRERDEARAELADLAGARDETIRGLRMTIAERDKFVQEMRRELGAALEQRDAATVARDAAQRELAERTADRDGADLAHADCERRLADMGDRFAALQAACQELREQIVVERAAAGAAQERSRMLDHEVESLKATAAAAHEALHPAEAAPVRKTRRRG